MKISEARALALAMWNAGYIEAADALNHALDVVEAGKREIKCECIDDYKDRKLSDPECLACSRCCDTAGELDYFEEG